MLAAGLWAKLFHPKCTGKPGRLKPKLNLYCIHIEGDGTLVSIVSRKVNQDLHDCIHGCLQDRTR